MCKPKKILMVAMPSLHFFRWTEQLKDSGFEVYWFDITGSGQYSERINWVHQKVDWKLKWNFPGRHTIKKNFPKVYKNIQKINEREASKAFEEYLWQVQPDLVHSFVLHMACLPILKVMCKDKNINWLYSSWGSDLYNKTNKIDYEVNLKCVLNRVNYLITDNMRDYHIAEKYGFQGDFLGAFPGGGGFKFNYGKITPVKDRQVILIKGYQGDLGRCLEVLQAVKELGELLKNYKIIVFGADEAVVDFVKKHRMGTHMNIDVFSKKKYLSHKEVLDLMGEALIYIGNSVSDGMPNTLLEAIVMGAFPIQSNPGGATEEVIANNVNGLIINDCHSIKEIKTCISKALLNKELLEKAFVVNQNDVKPDFEYNIVKKRVLQAYKKTT